MKMSRTRYHGKSRPTRIINIYDPPRIKKVRNFLSSFIIAKWASGNESVAVIIIRTSFRNIADINERIRVKKLILRVVALPNFTAVVFAPSFLSPSSSRIVEIAKIEAVAKKYGSEKRISLTEKFFEVNQPIPNARTPYPMALEIISMIALPLKRIGGNE